MIFNYKFLYKLYKIKYYLYYYNLNLLNYNNNYKFKKGNIIFFNFFLFILKKYLKNKGIIIFITKKFNKIYKFFIYFNKILYIYSFFYYFILKIIILKFNKKNINKF